MEQVHVIGIDLAKQGFQLQGAHADGSVAFRKKLTGTKLVDFLAPQPRCLLAMQACAGAHYWSREIGKLGHEVKVIPPVYVKPIANRHKNDAADAEATCEAAARPGMRFVAVKSEAQQSQGILFSARRRSTPCGATWRSSASSLRRVAPTSLGFRRPLPIRVRGCPRRSANWAKFCLRK